MWRSQVSRSAALAFLADNYIQEWKRAASGADQARAEERTWIIIQDGDRKRSDFLVEATAQFERKASEFQDLSGEAEATVLKAQARGVAEPPGRATPWTGRTGRGRRPREKRRTLRAQLSPSENRTRLDSNAHIPI